MQGADPLSTCLVQHGDPFGTWVLNRYLLNDGVSDKELPGGGDLGGTGLDEELGRAFGRGPSAGARALERLCSSDKCSLGQVPPAAAILGAGRLPLPGSPSERSPTARKQFQGDQILPPFYRY